MKKIAMFIAAAAMAVSASAQKEVVTSFKGSDNIYVGINGGVVTTVDGVEPFKVFDPTFGLRLGKNFTTVFGLAIDANMYMNAHERDCAYGNKTFIKGLDVDLLGTFNLMNLVGGYKGQPRTFEVIALGGFGWDHAFPSDADLLNSKVALDFALNMGSAKQWQVYVEPALAYNLVNFEGGKRDFKYNLKQSRFTIQAGLNYKFGCSNGTHNFTIEQLRDQAEIDGLNAKINAARAEADALKGQLAGKDAKIAELQKALNDCLNKPVPVVEKKAANLQPSVVFGFDKSVVEKSQMANIEMIAQYMKNHPEAKVQIKGYASPEGNKEYNEKLSQKRADAVKAVLVKKYKVAEDRLEAVGLGATDKLFDQVEFNRVALFDDSTK